jgi:hypothetical protein
MYFLPIEKTYGMKDEWINENTYLPMRVLSFNRFGLTELTPDAINEFKKRLENNRELLLRYLAFKLGYDASDPKELESGLLAYQDFAEITPKDETYVYICQMHASFTLNELNYCIERNTPAGDMRRL